MRIAIVGAGGIGAPLGAALARSGADVTFVARGAHLAAMRKDGLRVDGPRVSAHIQSTQATDNPAEIGLVDII
jgi:2-dehydropantoate 2-reductase